MAQRFIFVKCCIATDKDYVLQLTHDRLFFYDSFKKKETGGAEPSTIAHRLQLKPADLEREAAALRHMEKLRGELRDGKKFLTLW